MSELPSQKTIKDEESKIEEEALSTGGGQTDEDIEGGSTESQFENDFIRRITYSLNTLQDRYLRGGYVHETGEISLEEDLEKSDEILKQIEALAAANKDFLEANNDLLQRTYNF
ncbi:MAG: hypothetical protein XD95_0047, partial [Microgenomates bacterium 39_7]